MTRRTPATAALMLVTVASACSDAPAEQYGFVTTLGSDTISVERVARSRTKLVTDGVDRFPVVRQRHTEFELARDGRIRRMTMIVRSPNGLSPKERGRTITADFSGDRVDISVRDSAGVRDTSFNTGGAITVPHVSMMYSAIELEIAAAIRAAAGRKSGDSVMFRQFYPDRNVGPSFTLHRGWVHFRGGDTVVLRHDWLAGYGDVMVDSGGRMQTYDGSRSTYKVAVVRTTASPDVDAVAARMVATEKMSGLTQLSVRDTTRARIGGTSLSVDYGRPRARGRTLLGNVIEYGNVWRTGANAATQFTTSSPITLAGLSLPAGTYTLWTVVHSPTQTDLIVNRQVGQWGTGYGRAHDLGRAPMTVEGAAEPAELFTIDIVPSDATHGVLAMRWGDFRWSAPIVVR